MEQPESEWKRECPQCRCEISYKSYYSMLYASNDNRLCKRCSARNRAKNLTDEERQRRSVRRRQLNIEHYSGAGNPFYGHHHSQSTVERLRNADRLYAKTPEFSQKVKDAMIGIDTSVDLIKLWTDKFGFEEAQRREEDRRKKISLALSGERNPMFGKPAPRAAGAGIKGWYGEHFFRSLRELSFMLQLDREGKRWKTGETQEYAVPYVNPYTNVNATYFPDFIVDDYVMVECKPSNFHGTMLVRVKAKAAQAICEQRNMTYKLIDPKMITIDELLQLEQQNLVKLTERTKENINAHSSNNARVPGQREVNLGS